MNIGTGVGGPSRVPLQGRSRASFERMLSAAAKLLIERGSDDFTIADIALGAYARRWFGVEGIRNPQFSHLDRWYAQFSQRPGFKQFVAPPMS